MTPEPLGLLVRAASLLNYRAVHEEGPHRRRRSSATNMTGAAMAATRAKEALARQFRDERFGIEERSRVRSTMRVAYAADAVKQAAGVVSVWSPAA